ncbi:Sphingosine N-acyltransferase lag1 [Dispira parvispora]|uniref:Sphingosine N-acyltransferase lag1 n=1 Tax=Dispira parvispora TaxID=1520584 RepID=A0A9W8E4Q9_9FUNG|nr:Sphingosine N-acyltransferase lag1 [Dispira parvispora]
MSFLEQHQVELPLALIAAILAGNVLNLPLADKFITIQGRISHHSEEQYRNTLDDVYFVVFGLLLFTFIRASIMKYLLSPLAEFCQVKEAGKKARFCEQLWLVIYYTVSWSVGMYLMHEMPHWMNTKAFWDGYPHISMTWRFKAYYLLSISFWLQQFYVLQIEERRKDYYQMLLHHVVTCALLLSSYCSHFTRIGNAILCTMDFADIFLSGAKVLRYIKMQLLCDILFGVFVIVWIITRHIIYGIIVYSIYDESVVLLHAAPENPEEFYYSYPGRAYFLTLLISLQFIIIYWFVLIIRVITRVISGREAIDNRSSDDSDAGPTKNDQKKQN